MRNSEALQTSHRLPLLLPPGECRKSNPCQQLCFDLHDGTYECACHEGHQLDVNGYSCLSKCFLSCLPSLPPINFTHSSLPHLAFFTLPQQAMIVNTFTHRLPSHAFHPRKCQLETSPSPPPSLPMKFPITLSRQAVLIRAPVKRHQPAMITVSIPAMTSNAKQVEFALSLIRMTPKTVECDVDVHWAEVGSSVRRVSVSSFLFTCALKVSSVYSSY